MYPIKPRNSHNSPINATYIAVPDGDHIQILHETGGCKYKFFVGGDIISAPIIAGDRVSVTVMLPNGTKQAGIYTLQGGAINRKNL